MKKSMIILIVILIIVSAIGYVVYKDMSKDSATNTGNIPTQTVKLYYYNPTLDKDAAGNVLCSRKGIVSVERTIPVTKTPIQDVVKLLMQGNLTSSERAQGITTEFPLEGVTLQGASLKNGILKLEFDDPNNKTSGGSCRAVVLWFQIDATAKQFPGVNQVQFVPDTLFQP